jgi:hypothetical protein
MLKSERAVDRLTTSSIERAGHRHAARRCAKFPLDVGVHAHRLASRLDDPGDRRDVEQVGTVRIGHLRPWHVHHRIGVAIECAVVHVCDHADDLTPGEFHARAHSAPDGDTVRQRIGVLPEPLGQRLIDDRDGRRAGGILIREAPSPKNRNLEGLKIGRRDRREPAATM